jgi:predicted Zn-dependent protease
MPSANLKARSTRDPSFAARFNTALKLRSRKNYEQAKELLLDLADENADSASVFGILGDVYWRLGSLPEAIQCFRRAVELSPTSELASLGLFHALWEAGQYRQAREEMKRFVSTSHSPEYARILGELIPLPSTTTKPQAGRRVAAKKPRVRKGNK